MLRRLGVAIAYFVAMLYILLIVWPAIYCYRTGCKGPGDLDAFMPAFFLVPWGGVAAAFSLRNSIRQIRKGKSWSWVFWPAAIAFATMLLATIAFIAVLIYFTAFRRFRSG